MFKRLMFSLRAYVKKKFKMDDELEFEKMLSVLKANDNWGTYYMDKFYFSIKTNRSRKDVGLDENNKLLSDEMQKKLQYENYPAFFHEYIHYLHELSTVSGSVGMGLGLTIKAIFTHWLEKDPKSAKSLGISQLYGKDRFIKLNISNDILMADDYRGFKGKFADVKGITTIKQEIYFPHENGMVSKTISTPKLEVSEYVNGKTIKNFILFGKYFLYEGIAYELDRMVDKQTRMLSKIDDTCNGSEYVVLRRLAHYIFPEISKINFLKAASMSLQYVECGSTFILFINLIKENHKNGTSQDETINKIKQETSQILKLNRENYFAVNDEYRDIFKNRILLFQAYSYITNEFKKLYDERIKNPTFEIELVFDGKHEKLLDIAQICDYVYIFNDDIEYNRDFIGTAIDLDTSYALKALLTFNDYYKAHNIKDTFEVEKNENKCPFYHCCELPIRLSQVNICRLRPWRMYEVSSKSDGMYCWYGQGVIQTKGFS